MNCLDPEQIYRYMDKKVSDDESRLIEAHLAVCEKCRRAVEEIAEVEGLIDTAEYDLSDCPTDEEIDEYLEGRIDPKRKGILDAHKKKCSVCSYLLDPEKQKTHEQVGEGAPPKSFLSLLKNRLRTRRTQRIKEALEEFVKQSYPKESIFYEKLWRTFEEREDLEPDALPEPLLAGALGAAGSELSENLRAVQILVGSAVHVLREAKPEELTAACQEEILKLAKTCGLPKKAMRGLERFLDLGNQ